ncbi:MAG TPA: DUF1688 family protein [Polyangiaceae bacterium]|nr:DUF1688 family protein [Polyangiaceae bacterium]
MSSKKPRVAALPNDEGRTLGGGVGAAASLEKIASASALTEVELTYLKSPRAIRERAHAVLQLAQANQLAHFALRPERLPELAKQVLRFTLENYGELSRVPYHSRYRHFNAAGVDRVARLDAALVSLSPLERLRAEADLVIVTVLLDAGAGASFRYRESQTGLVLRRSEGLAIASFDWFMSGDLALDRRTPLRVESARLQSLEACDLERAFQVGAENPLLGVTGRTELLQRLGEVTTLGTTAKHDADANSNTAPRPGDFVVQLCASAKHGTLRAADVFERVLSVLSPIWPRHLARNGLAFDTHATAAPALGDVFIHPQVGYVPFHKLSQWLTYSLCEAIERFGLRVEGLDELTGLPEYRNGGLLLDAGVLELREPAEANREHTVSSPLIVEWRALTVALLDELAGLVRHEAGATPESLPLVKLLEGGTWSLGRRLAEQRRPGAAPPLRVQSDGTVF